MRKLLIFVTFIAGCAAGPVRKVDWLNFTEFPQKNMVLACTYIYDERRLICATPENFLLLQTTE